MTEEQALKLSNEATIKTYDIDKLEDISIFEQLRIKQEAMYYEMSILGEEIRQASSQMVGA
jgi:hypothetical protein